MLYDVLWELHKCKSFKLETEWLKRAQMQMTTN